ncbi:Ammonium transporter [Pseudomonas sp. R4-35-07]|nr:Ammonium transporter [Pseudomonas sp. R3-52-08]AZF25824.1 Ammonium transporter [Pseudomonas sp. R2-60-08W]AZF31187.1 Ammonium transporter [Pseudomonas sp. R4-35-07]
MWLFCTCGFESPGSPKVHCDCVVQLLLCLGAHALGPALNPGGLGENLEKPYPN